MSVATSSPQKAPDRQQFSKLVSISGKPLETFSSQSSQATRPLQCPGQQVACSSGGGLPALVLQYFTPNEWSQLNPGRYHDESHPVHVANTVGELALSMGGSPERAKFLQQVALLHDADERIDPNTGDRNPVSPARAPVTLEWMDHNQSSLQDRMGWKPDDFLEAKALIARSDFPFNEGPKKLGTKYDGQSPVEVYENLLGQLPQERREQAMQDALKLRFADQVGSYTLGKEESVASIFGLAQEMRGVGIAITDQQMLDGTPAFLRGVGSDTDFDWKVASRLGVATPEFPDRDKLIGALGDRRREEFLGLDFAKP